MLGYLFGEKAEDCPIARTNGRHHDSVKKAARDRAPILVFSERYPPVVGGSAKWLAKIAEYWSAGPVMVLAGLRPDGSVHDPHGPGNLMRMRLRMKDWGLDSLDSVSQYAAGTARLMKVLGQSPKETMVICGRGLPEGLIARLACGMTGRRYWCVAHGEEVLACRSSAQLRRMLPWAYRGAQGVICNSQSTARLVRSTGIQEDRIHVSHPGVDPHLGALCRPESRGGGRIHLLSVGRLEDRKNHAGVIRAMQKLVQEGHCVDYLIVGSGPKVQSLRALTRELGLEDIVRFQLSATDEQVAEAFACCDIFVMPSVATATDLEGFGIVYIEAAMHGLVSISGNVGGCAEAVLDRETGLVVDGRDPQALYEALEELILHPELRKELGNRGRRRAQAELTWPHVVGQMQHMMIGETTPMKG